MKSIINFLFCLLVTFAYAQNSPLDSLKGVVYSDAQDTFKVLAYNDIAMYFVNHDPDSALPYVRKGLALSQQTRFQKGEAESLNILGSVYSLFGDYTQSLEYFLASLKLSEQLKDSHSMARANANMSIIFSVQNDLESSLKYLKKSKAIVESMDNPYLLIYPFTNLGSIYLDLDQLDSSLYYSNHALKLAIEYNKVFHKAIIYYNLGDAYFKLKNNELAAINMREAFAISNQVEYVDIICGASLGLAQYYKNVDANDSSLYFAKYSLNKAHTAEFPKLALEASTFLSRYYKELNIVDSAYHYQNISIAVKDSLFSQEKVREFQKLGFLETVRQQDILEEKLAYEQRRRSNIQILGVGTFISFFFILILALSKRNINPKFVKYIGLLWLLLLFEFVSLILGKYLDEVTNNNPVLTLSILVVVATILMPIHNKLQKWINQKLVTKSHAK